MSFTGIGGGQVGLAFGPQFTQTSVPPSVDKMRHEDFADTAGRIVWRSTSEIGGTLFGSGLDAIVVGARPRFRGRGICRLGSYGHLIQMAGMKKGANTGDGSATPFVLPFAPVANNDLWVPYAVDINYKTATHYRHQGAKLSRLVTTITPGEPPRVDYDGNSRDHLDSVLTQDPEISRLIPSPGATILSANLQLFGAATSQLMSLVVEMDNNLDTENQAIGAQLSQAVVGTRGMWTMRGTLALDDSFHGSLNYGAAAATTITAALVEGALTCRLNTAKNVSGSAPYNVPGYIEWNMPDALYFLGDMIDITPDRMVVIPFVAIPTLETFNINIMNGTNGADYVQPSS